MDATAYPHLLDAIIAAAAAPTLQALRLVSRETKHRADRVLAANLALSIRRLAPLGGLEFDVRTLYPRGAPVSRIQASLTAWLGAEPTPLPLSMRFSTVGILTISAPLHADERPIPGYARVADFLTPLAPRLTRLTDVHTASPEYPPSAVVAFTHLPEGPSPAFAPLALRLAAPAPTAPIVIHMTVHSGHYIMPPRAPQRPVLPASARITVIFHHSSFSQDQHAVLADARPISEAREADDELASLVDAIALSHPHAEYTLVGADEIRGVLAARSPAYRLGLSQSGGDVAGYLAARVRGRRRHFALEAGVDAELEGDTSWMPFTALTVPEYASRVGNTFLQLVTIEHIHSRSLLRTLQL